MLLWRRVPTGRQWDHKEYLGLVINMGIVFGIEYHIIVQGAVNIIGVHHQGVLFIIIVVTMNRK